MTVGKAAAFLGLQGCPCELNTGPQSQLLVLSEERFEFSYGFGTLERIQIYVGLDDLDDFYPSFIFLDGLFVSGIILGA